MAFNNINNLLQYIASRGNYVDIMNAMAIINAYSKLYTTGGSPMVKKIPGGKEGAAIANLQFAMTGATGQVNSLHQFKKVIDDFLSYVNNTNPTFWASVPAGLRSKLGIRKVPIFPVEITDCEGTAIGTAQNIGMYLNLWNNQKVDADKAICGTNTPYLLQTGAPAYLIETRLQPDTSQIPYNAPAVKSHTGMIGLSEERTEIVAEEANARFPNSPVTPVTVETLGQLFRAPLMDISEYTVVDPNSTWAISNGIISTDNPSTPGFTNYIYYDSYQTSLMKWTIDAAFTLDSTLDAATDGLAFGVFGRNPEVSPLNTYIHFVSDNSGDQGKLRFYSNGVLEQTSTLGLAIAGGDQIRLKIVRDEMTLIATVTNLTQGGSLTDTYVGTPVLSNVLFHHRGSFGIWNEGGDHEVFMHKVSSHAKKNIDICFIGDSITTGNSANVVANIYRKLIESSTKLVTETIAAPGNAIEDVYACLHEALAMKANTYILMIGGNNEAFGNWDATSQALYDTYTQALESTGAQVIHCTPSARDGDDMTPVVTYLETNHSPVINLFEPTADIGGTTLASLLHIGGDGTHPHELGHAVYFETIKHKAYQIWPVDPRKVNNSSIRFTGVDLLPYGNVLNDVFSGAAAAFTINVVARRAANNVLHTICSKWESTGNQRALTLQILADNRLSITLYEDGTTSHFLQATSTTLLTDLNKFYRISVAYDETLANENKITMMIDGVSETVVSAETGTFNDITTSTAQFTIGSQFAGGSGSAQFNGWLQEFSIFTTAFSETEMSEWQGNTAPIAADEHSQAANLEFYDQLGESAYMNVAGTALYTYNRSGNRYRGNASSLNLSDITSETIV